MNSQPLTSHMLKLVKIYDESLPVSVSGKLNVEKMKNNNDDLFDMTQR